MSEQCIWGIHAGKSGEADHIFLRKNVVALGWNRVHDLKELKPNREAFKSVIAQAYPNKKPGAIPNIAGQLFRFVHEMKIGDLIAYPAKKERMINIGEVTGDYTFELIKGTVYPHQRVVSSHCRFF